jgi:hypothetical protein
LGSISRDLNGFNRIDDLGGAALRGGLDRLSFGDCLGTIGGRGGGLGLGSTAFRRRLGRLGVGGWLDAISRRGGGLGLGSTALSRRLGRRRIGDCLFGNVGTFRRLGEGILIRTPIPRG